MSLGVEWALHSCLSLAMAGAHPPADATDTATAPGGRPVTTRRLADLHGLAPASLNKTLQLLVRAGVIRSVPGPGGGVALTRHPAEISFLDIVQAVEGVPGAFRYTELRRRGRFPADPEACLAPCAIAATMADAERAWRQVLDDVSLADKAAELAIRLPDVPPRTRTFLEGATAP